MVRVGVSGCTRRCHDTDRDKPQFEGGCSQQSSDHGNKVELTSDIKRRRALNTKLLLAMTKRNQKPQKKQQATPTKFQALVAPALAAEQAERLLSVYHASLHKYKYTCKCNSMSDR